MPAFGLAYLFGEDQLFTIYEKCVNIKKSGLTYKCEVDENRIQKTNLVSRSLLSCNE